MKLAGLSKITCTVAALISAHVVAQQTETLSPKADTIKAAATASVTTTGGTSGIVPVFSGTSSIANSALYYSNGSLGIGKSPAAALDISGITFFGGQAVVEKSGTATTTSSYASHSLQFQTSAYNSSSRVAVSPYLEFEAEPTGNNTSAPTVALHLLYGSGTGAASDSGFYINANGTLVPVSVRLKRYRPLTVTSPQLTEVPVAAFKRAVESS